MKRLLKNLAFLPLVLLLTACPYESTVPVTEAAGKVDGRLMGKWLKEGENNPDYPSEYYVITQDSESKYKIVKSEFNSSDSTYSEDNYIGHLSDLGDKVFLNMQKDGKFYIHRVDIEDGRFTLFEVTDNVDEKFSNSKELEDFVRKHMNLSFFYNKDEKIYVKAQ